MHVVPLRAAGADDRRVTLAQDEPHQRGHLLAGPVDWPAPGAVDGRRANDGGPNGRGGVGGEHELVDRPVVRLIGQCEDAVDVGDVAVGLLRERWLPSAVVGLVVL